MLPDIHVEELYINVNVIAYSYNSYNQFPETTAMPFASLLYLY